MLYKSHSWHLPNLVFSVYNGCELAARCKHSSSPDALWTYKFYRIGIFLRYFQPFRFFSNYLNRYLSFFLFAELLGPEIICQWLWRPAFSAAVVISCSTFLPPRPFWLYNMLLVLSKISMSESVFCKPVFPCLSWMPQALSLIFFSSSKP